MGTLYRIKVVGISKYLLGLVLLLSPFLTLAQNSPSILVDISPCINITSIADRIDCYDTLATQYKESNENLTTIVADSIPIASSNVVVPAENIVAPVEDIVAPVGDVAAALTQDEPDNFGFPPEPVIATESTNNSTDLYATVAEIDMFRRNILQITLNNGQQWRQMSAKSYRLREGEEVRISPSGFGSTYRLHSERIGSFIQVRRIR